MQAESEAGTGRPTAAGLFILGVILGWTTWCHLPSLDHCYLPGWDEAVHAAVAGNLAKHPTTPTLFDQPFVPYDRHDWQANHVWLHMPPLPFWQAALSVAVGGRSFFTLRFPNLLLFMLTMALIYGLGIRLYNEAAGLLGALLLAASPFAWMQVQGYHFGDMTDVSLAFWLTACVLALERAVATGRLRWMIASGLAQGLALLTKSALALAPAGAAVVIWLLPRTGVALQPRPGWKLPAVHLGVALVPAFAWRLYSSLRWPEEFAREQAALWAHVTTSYEGHGRPWDAVFNDLIANLFTPPFVLLALAATGLVVLRAWRSRRCGHALHALWIVGTLLPLSLVRTKVPALLFGVFPAMALATGVLLARSCRRPGVWTAAAAVTPVIYLLLVDLVPADFWRFAEPVTPDMAVWPHLPMQAIFFLAALGMGLAARAVIDRLLPDPGRAHNLLLGGGILMVRLAAAAALIVLVGRICATRDGFEMIASYNPAARTALAVRDDLPDRAAVMIEGVTNGRQRPDLTFSFLTGHPAHLVRRSGLARTLAKARKHGNVFLVSPVLREGIRVDAPAPGAGYWVYRVEDGVPAPDTSDPGRFLARYPAGPDLVSLTPATRRVRPGSPLDLLAVWRAKGPVRDHGIRVVLEPEAGGEVVQPYPREEHFPAGHEGVVLHTLAPAGLLWGTRPIGTGLGEPYRLGPDEVVADAFMIWVPEHLLPGRYAICLRSLRGDEVQRTLAPVAWPVIEVTP